MARSPEVVSDSPSLPPALARTLAAVAPGPEHDRLARMFAAAAKAIAALGEMDLGRWENPEAETADLSAWEALAPVVSDTLLAVQGFLDAVGPDGALAPESAHDLKGPVGRAGASGAVIRDFADQLIKDRTAFGEGLKKPAVAADRWSLIAHVSEFRGRFRHGIGKMVFLAAELVVPVRKIDVVPFYRDELDAAVLLRRAVVLVGQAVHADRRRFRGADDHGRNSAARSILDQLDTFLASKPGALLRVVDKRPLLATRNRLAAALEGAAPETRLVGTVDDLDGFLGVTLQRLNRRETLNDHDREVLDAVGLRLDRTQAALRLKQRERALAELAVAVSTAQRLLGRNRELDTLLLALRGIDPGALDVDPALRLAAALRNRIERVPAP